ncbi:riboflavin synthase [Sandaracinobacteroides saxicola]|uniref:Riboflavin synthase n=1 Tax=Sandaracinobacteroides saxicola TaxID=2759707 RepID=A0A7G5IG23_9SPHN|nr:riboflavin synthase [Sandaracinobacteroides saxicola]QMW22315.1 riboflavin synthase [Sandaracinobacteroides saxicola]
MFTGIITDVGRIASASRAADADLRLWVQTAFDLDTVDLGASIACSGVCLTVVAKQGQRFAVDVSGESVRRTAPGMWEEGRALNLERALRLGDELGGHIVTGHVDGVGQVSRVWHEGGSMGLEVAVPADLAPFIAAKGSITLDGISLTVNSVADDANGTRFTLNIIPHTAQWTTLRQTPAIGQPVNLEIDLMARYLKRMRDIAS